MSKTLEHAKSNHASFLRQFHEACLLVELRAAVAAPVAAVAAVHGGRLPGLLVAAAKARAAVPVEHALLAGAQLVERRRGHELPARGIQGGWGFVWGLNGWVSVGVGVEPGEICTVAGPSL